MKEQRGFPAQGSEHLKTGDQSERAEEEVYDVPTALTYPMHDIDYPIHDLDGFVDLAKARFREYEIQRNARAYSITF